MPTQCKYAQTPQNPLAGAAVAVVGDVMIDRFISGSVDRISPEAPVPVVRVSGRTTHLGGAGNVATNLATLGATPYLTGRLGQDEMANAFMELGFKNKVNTDYMVRGEGFTTCKTRIVARSQQVVRLDEEEEAYLADSDRAALKQQLKALREKADVVIVSDYGKGVIDQDMLDEIKTLWRDGTILADPKPRKSISYKGVNLITPNRAEAALLAAPLYDTDTVPLRNDADVAEAARRLMAHFGLSHILITRSEQGMTIASNNGQITHLPTLSQEVADVSGAGDTVIATMAASLAAGLDIVSAAQLSNLSAGVVVGKLGTATCTWAELHASALEQAESAA